MKVLLDTHAYLWLITNPNKVGKRAKALVSSPESEVLVSVVSFIEIAIKSKKGKIDFDFTLVEKTLNSLTASILDLKLDHVRGLAELDPIHDDPFDRMLIAQAQCENAVLLSADVQVQRYSCSWAWN